MIPPVMASFGSNLSELRVRAGYKRKKDFAAAVGVKPSQLSDWEKDRYRSVDSRTLIQLAKALKCSLDDLLEGIDAEYDAARPARIGRQPAVVRERPTRPYGYSGAAAPAPEPTLDAELLAEVRQIIEILRPLLDKPKSLEQLATVAEYWAQIDDRERVGFLGLMHDLVTSRVVDARHIPGARRAESMPGHHNRNR